MDAPVNINLTVDINLKAWADECDMSTTYARNYIRETAAKMVEDWLRQRFRSATVHINNTPYRPSRMQS